LARVLFENVKNPFVRSFLRDNLDEFVRDVHAFSCDIFANLSAERKPYIKSAGLAFLSAPIVSLSPQLPWHRIKIAVEIAVRETLSVVTGQDCATARMDKAKLGEDNDTTDLIERAIMAAFVSSCESANGYAGAILVGGLADLLGRYIALYVAGSLDEAGIQLLPRIKSDDTVSTESSDKSGLTADFYSPCNAQTYVEEC